MNNAGQVYSYFITRSQKKLEKPRLLKQFSTSPRTNMRGVGLWIHGKQKFFPTSYLVLTSYSVSSEFKPGWKPVHKQGYSDKLSNLRWKINILDELTDAEYKKWNCEIKFAMDVPRLHNRLQDEYAKNYKWFRDDPVKRDKFFKKMFE